MIPVGYMAKRIAKTADLSGFSGILRQSAVVDIYSVSGCISEYFTDYIQFWKHSGYWLFDSPEIIRGIAREHSINFEGTSLFYYEAYEMEFDGDRWRPFAPEPALPTHVIRPARKQLEGFDVVAFSAGTAPECSPLSCNGLAGELPTNPHCLFATFDEAEAALRGGAFLRCEPGPYRIFAVYTVDWE